MTIILFLIDTSASMNQRTYLGARPTLLDVAKDAVEKFLKARARDIASRGDRYMLLTFEDPPLNIKAGWKESHAVFMNELKHLTATGVTNMGPALKNAFDLLNLNRMQSGIDMYGHGRAPYYLEPSMIVVITDGSSLTHQAGVQQTLELPMQNNSVPGSELTREPFRWDQRLFSLVLRLTGSAPAEAGPNSAALNPDHSSIGAMCAVTAGRSYLITTQRSILQSIEALVQKVQSGVVIQFEKFGPDPPPLDNETNDNQVSSLDTNHHTTSNENNTGTDTTQHNAKQNENNQITVVPNWHNTRSLIYVHRAVQKNFSVGHWPIPEAYWPDPSLNPLPPRTAHPIVKFSCAPSEPHMMDALPFDKYELESSPLTQYILSRKQPHVAWQVFICNSSKSGEAYPFGYLKAATSLNCVNLFVMPYNYPVLLPLIDEMLNKPQHGGKPRDWKPAFEEYLRTMPLYYARPLKAALSRMGVQNNQFLENLESTFLSFPLNNKLKSHKIEAKIQFERLIQSMQHQPKNQNSDIVRVLQCGNNLRSQVESTSYCNMECTGRPTNSFYFRYSAMKNELNEFPNFVIRVRDKASAFSSNENSRIKHTFRNPFDIDRKDLIDQIHLMRSNFMQSPSRIKYKDEDQIHTLPVSQMGNYQDYLKKQPTPLREIESTPVRQHMFGNPFKIDKKGMMVDEADNLGLNDVGNPSQKNKKINPNQRRRGPLPKNFILLNQNSWQRSNSNSPIASSPTPPPTEDDSRPDSTIPKANNTIRPTVQDLALRSDIFKNIRGPGMNYASVLKQISKLEGEKRKYILDETIREAKRFKKVRLLHQLNLISRQ